MGMKDLTGTLQMGEMAKLYFGSDNTASQLDVFMERLQPYSSMFEQKDVYGTGASNVTDTPFVIASPFSVEGTDWVIKGNLTKENLSKTLLPNKKHKKEKNPKLTGRTLLKKATDEIKGAKKIVSLVPEAVKEKILADQVNGEYSYASGKSEEDLIYFLRMRMYNWHLYNGPSGVANDKPSTPDAAKVLIEAVNALEWDLSDTKAAARLFFDACTTGSVKVSFPGTETSSLMDIYSFIVAEDNPSPADLLREFVKRNGLSSGECEEDALALASEFFSAETTSDGMKMKSFKKDWYPDGWCLFWLQGPLSKAPKKYRVNILKLVDDSIEEEKDEDSGRKKHRDNEKKAKDEDRRSGAANGGDRGTAYRDKKDLAVIAQQQQKQDQNTFLSKMAKMTTVLKSLESSRENCMKMAAEWRLGGDMDKWKTYMVEAENLEKTIATKRSELDKLEHKKSTTSHVDSFLSIGTKFTSASQPTSAKKRKAVESTDVDSDSDDN